MSDIFQPGPRSLQLHFGFTLSPLTEAEATAILNGDLLALGEAIKAGKVAHDGDSYISDEAGKWYQLPSGANIGMKFAMPFRARRREAKRLKRLNLKNQ